MVTQKRTFQMVSLRVGDELATYILLFWHVLAMRHGWYVLAVSIADLAPVKRFCRPAFSKMLLLMYYLSKSASPATEEKSQATFKSMTQLRNGPVTEQK